MSSWLFGRRQPQDFSEFVPPAAGGAGGDDGDKKDDNKTDGYKFDSSGFERAAKAVKDLEKSPFAQQALELSKTQELTKQQELHARAKEFEVQVQQTIVDGKRVEAEERRKTIQEQAKLDQQKSQYQDQLARKRYDDQLVQQQRSNEENLRRQEESAAKLEAMRKGTIEHELEHRHKYDMKRIQTEMSTRAKLDRENQDLTLEQIRVKAAEDRETTIKSLKEKRETALASITSATSAIGVGLNAFLSDPKKMQASVIGFVALTAGYYSAKGALGLLFRLLEARLGKPSLVRETSRLNAFDVLRHPIQSIKKLKRKSGDALSEVILNPELEERVRDIAIAAKNTKKNRGLFRNILLHGPPGTGKTLFAKQLAMNSNMDYAIMTGGDVALLGKESVLAIHKVFDWARASPKGLILFIDEAEGFLSRRRKDISEELQMSMSAFLYHTGTQNDKFMMVLATNTPDVLDFAVVSRVQEPVKFPLPTLSERHRLVLQYYKTYIADPILTGRSRLKRGEFDHKSLMFKIAQMTDGMSGREIANMALDWQMTTYASEDGKVTKEIMLKRAIAAVNHKRETVLWRSEDETRRTTSSFSQAVVDAVQMNNAGISIMDNADKKNMPNTKEDTKS